MEHKLQVEQHSLGYYIVTCPEGHYLTLWKEGDDIMDFNSYKISFSETNLNLEDKYRCLTEAENNALIERKNEYIESQKTQEEKDAEAYYNAMNNEEQ